MSNKINILIVEDNMLIGAKISMLLDELGYEAAGLMPRAEDALTFLADNTPDILLLDIKLKGKMDGIQLAETISQDKEIPVIFLTSNTDEATFNRAKATKPYAFISKPYKKLDLQRAIELTISMMDKGENLSAASTHETKGVSAILNDRIFVRYRDRMVKLFIKDIYYIEAERNYSRIFTKEKEYLLTMTLKVVDEKLPKSNFLRVHRSFIINLSHIEEVKERSITVGRQSIPYSVNHKEILLTKLRML